MDNRQGSTTAVTATKRCVVLEKESSTFLAQTTMGAAGGNMAAVASQDLSDVPSPTALMTDSGALFVKNALVHISLSTLSPGSLGK